MPYVTFLDSILGPIGVYEGLRSIRDENFIDRMSHYYTNIFLLFFTILVATEDYTEPIHCWCPEEFTDIERVYTQQLCWISNTYRIPFAEPIPPQFEPRDNDEVTYYQWVPLILLLMAAFFTFPRQVWRYCSQQSGVGIKKMLFMVHESMKDPPAEREKKIRIVAEFIECWCANIQPFRSGMYSGIREKYGQFCSLGVGRHYGNYLVTLCVFVKFLYFLNAVGQLYFLNEFLGGKDFWIYGYEVVYKVILENNWGSSSRFPKITLCDFDLRQIENVQRWTLQCVLPVNLYNEKIFIFLWFWITLVAFLSLGNLIYSLFLVFYPRNKTTFAKKYLKMENVYDKGNYLSRKMVRKFADGHLRQDGIFLLKMIAFNTNTVFVSKIIKILWEKYRERVHEVGKTVENEFYEGKRAITRYIPEPNYGHLTDGYESEV
ncbi:innexin unc-9-like isoform X1 [Ostrea edulis]|uniref:innexin unc-9-like isoform X1 n=1 Tax=Ostrea edulis TaxID=37623 RepID=UPI0020949DFA|nr:innexin unc-9-like isoform X1 [Ostrea edulis]